MFSQFPPTQAKSGSKRKRDHKEALDVLAESRPPPAVTQVSRSFVPSCSTDLQSPQAPESGTKRKRDVRDLDAIFEDAEPHPQQLEARNY